jgi:hypothetical protein
MRILCVYRGYEGDELDQGGEVVGVLAKRAGPDLALDFENDSLIERLCEIKNAGAKSLVGDARR